MPPSTPALADADYAALADFRHALRQFQAFSEARATEQGLTPQQHQALLTIRAAAPDVPSVGHVAERLMLKPHSATGLIDRLERLGLIERTPSPTDRRSEEHTSELQSLMRISYAVFCLKKKKKRTHNMIS